MLDAVLKTIPIVDIRNGGRFVMRTLDWPFPGLGRHLEVAHMRGHAGDFDNVTWPRLCRRADRIGARPLRGLYQSGADVAAHAASLA